MNKEKTIYVYADFPPYCNKLIGKIYVSQVRARENYAFEYELEWLETKCTFLDPELQLYRGRQYVGRDKNIWGIFSDSCPDRYGSYVAF